MRLLRAVMCAALLPGAVAAQSRTLRVSEIASTRGPVASPFGSVFDMMALADGRIVITDEVSPAVWLWDVSRDTVTQIARKGDGPGEVSIPTEVAERDQGGFAVYDIGHLGFMLFSRELRFERTVQTASGIVSNPKDLLVLSDGSFVVAGGRLRETSQLQEYGPDGQLVGVWGRPAKAVTDRSARVQYVGGALCRGAGTSFLFAMAAPYRILRFPGPGFARPTVLAENDQLVPEPTDDNLLRPTQQPGIKTFGWYFDRTSGIVTLKNGDLLTVVTRFYRGDSVWSIHDPSGALVQRAVVRRAYNLYGREGDDTFLASYRDAETDVRVAVLLRVSGN